MKRVLVTGASGFIGQHLLPHLTARGFEVHAVHSQTAADKEAHAVSHCADLFAALRVKALFKELKPSHLVHLAWIATPGIYQNSLENLRWVQASIEIARQFVANGGTRIVGIGSCAEYDWSGGLCSEAATPTIPSSLYGVCKLSVGSLLAAMAKETATSVAWARLFFPYGPREHSQRLIPSVIQSLLRQEAGRCSLGTQIRDYIFVDDVAGAIAALLESDVSGPINVASGVGVSVRDIVTKIATIMDRPELIQLGALKQSVPEANEIVGDVARLVSELRWTPQYNLERGLKTTIEWWREHYDGNATV